MKKSLFVLVAVLLLTGCGSNKGKETTTTCKSSGSYLVYESSEQEYVSKGDSVKQLNSKSVLVFNSKEELDATVENAQANLDAINELEGVEASVEIIDETSAYDIMKINLDKADLPRLSELGILQVNTENSKAMFVSLKQSVELLESEGFTCESK
ncbi:DUF1307 domain-containing protein [Erysipelothrix urinaevulpis]|uniref:DUF1307 domain-containing protein n=1 Tax=Erysipelothrix urinaevulpis TaxID=2683717 RepID=UPI00135818A5|nr:DUF1307 domain-containing protein [Erysipelothrix urinaevulpis]